MRPRLSGCANRLVGCGPKTQYPLFKALLHRGEQCLRETDRHVSKRRRKCLLRSRVDVREDMRDLFTGKPGSQTRLDEMATLDFGDLVVTAFPGTHRKFHVLGLKLPGIQRRLDGQHIVKWRHDEAAAGHQRDAEVLGMSICGPDQPEQNVGLQEVRPVAQRLVTTLKQAADLNDSGTALALVLPGRRDG